MSPQIHPVDKDSFREVMQRVDAADFTSYIYQYPPLAVWPVFRNDVSIHDAWAQSLAVSRSAGLYVHVPFCSTKCTFCRFFVLESDRTEDRNLFLEALDQEIRLWAPIFRTYAFRTLYVGGGTPSLLGSDQMRRFFRMLRRYFVFTRDCQVSFEANPEFLTSSKLEVLRDAGVERLTLGVQSLDNTVTREVERTQSNPKVHDTYLACRKAGIRYINIDLMAGLPKQTLKSFQETLEEVVCWHPDMIHVNPFLPTPFTRFVQRGGSLRLDPKSQADMLEFAKKCLDDHGYRQISYDAVGLDPNARNKQLEDGVIWNKPFLGLGPGAISCAAGQMRYVNHPNMVLYRRSLAQGIPPVLKACSVNLEDDCVNFIMNHLRYGSLDSRNFQRVFGHDIPSQALGALRRLERLSILRRNHDGEGHWEMIAPFNEGFFEVRRAFFSSEVIQAVLERKTINERIKCKNKN